MLATICNFFQFSRTMVSFDMNDLDSFPLIILLVSEVAEFIYDNYFKDLHNKNLAMIQWLPHSLLTYPQKYFQACIPTATKPNNLRDLKAQEPIYPRTFKESEIFFSRLMDIPRSCIIGDKMGMLSCPPHQYLTSFLPLINYQEEI